MFLVGNKIKAGLVGTHPSLAPQDLFQGDIRHRIDFRSVYASVLESWLVTPSAPVLGQPFLLVQIV
jgi:uncharacterized protein (DUF1501 family)